MQDVGPFGAGRDRVNDATWTLSSAQHQLSSLDRVPSATSTQPTRYISGSGDGRQGRGMHDAALENRENRRRLVRSRGLEPPRVAPLAPQASASTTSATTASGRTPGPQGPRRQGNGAACNKS